jgi:cyclic beta-1,2-glucan synthetase
VTEQENWLAPDNYQEDPKPLVAHRTSPTNLGLLLLSTCSAYDFGYLGSFEVLRRLRRSLSTMLKLEHCFGHFYNWYDTQTLQALVPKYISTVDSGNLAGHLITVKQVCLSMMDEPIVSPKCLMGINDTLKIIEEKRQNLNHNLQGLNDDLLLTRIHECLDSCVCENGSSLFSYRSTLSTLKQKIEVLNEAVDSLKHKNGDDSYQEITEWIKYSLSMTKSYIDQIDSILPYSEEDLNAISHLLKEQGSQLFSKWQQLFGSLGSIKSFKEHQSLCKNISDLIAYAQVRRTAKGGKPIPLENTLLQVQKSFIKVSDLCGQMSKDAIELSETCNQLVVNMDFKVLFDRQRKLFSIGYNVEHGKLDDSYYDLLASESRLASFIAIAKGDVPQSHWFHLGRQMTSIYKQRVLISWSASMFEYLMPLLVMKNYPDTLLNETQIAVIKQQMIYGKIQGVPWGVSESAYNARDLQMNYQYGPFGVPGLGLKRGLSDDLVISPYSTALGALVLTQDVYNNFTRLKSEKAFTDFGFYESIDYTKGRIQPGQNHAIVRNFMVHHQGMILTALDNVINDNILQIRFHQDLMIRSSELLLQERTPKRVSISHPRLEETHVEKTEALDKHPNLRHINFVDTPHPITQVLSNGKYTVMLTAGGSGFSKCGKVSLSRWNEDSISNTHGSFIFIEDVISNLSWSTSFKPMNDEPMAYKTTFSEHKAEFWCHKNEIASHTEVIVSPEDDVEMRRVTLINHSNVVRTLNLTSYLEPILTSHQADIAHRAFSNLFIETEYIPSKTALLAHRRKRTLNEDEIWGFHLVTFGGENTEAVQYETNRKGFIGRSNDISTPIVVKNGIALSNTVGAVLDPAFSLRKQITLVPHETVRLCFVSGLARSREDALRTIDRYHDQHVFDREDEMGWTQSQAELRHLNISFDEAKCFQELGGGLLYPSGPMRSVLGKQDTNSKSQSALWAYGISGDNPILFVVIKNKHEIHLIRQLLHAHEYFRFKGITYDMVILNAETSSYRQALNDELMHQVRMSGQQGLFNKHGGIFILRKDTIPLEDLALFRTTARVFINAENGNLKEQLERLKLNERILKENPVRARFPRGKRESIPLSIPKRQFENGCGGFTEDGKEYVIYLEFADSTPAPWCNVIANDSEFGFLVSERGSSCTWSGNSRENRITPFSNDPVSDPSGESIYITDLESGEKWSPTPGPMKGPEPYMIRHGQGYTHFENNNYEVSQRLSMFCPSDKEVKVCQLILKNESNNARKLSIFYYIELVLGSQRAKTAHHITTEQGKTQNVFLARNSYNEEYGKRITYVASSEPVLSFTCDRRSFLGTKGDYQNPSGINEKKLDQQNGAGLDPCFALQVVIELAPNEEKEINFLLGQASSEATIYPIIENIFDKDGISNEFKQVNKFWDNILTSIQVKTPFPEFDILMNRWLLYQNLSCRIWARTAFYQSGGAFGFRDQLQDVTALLHSAPEVARQHILLAASCQFKEGDVLHWWHPPSKKGVRTHFSDDLLWLPYVVATYVKVTGNVSILDEVIPFVEGPEVPAEQEDLYFQPELSETSASIYEHCVRAIDRSLALGVHGLPLIGTGDWNDGLSQVGAKGKGESVWMAWFLISIINSFTELCEKKEDGSRIVAYRDHVKKLSDALETTGWDGNWYKRAYFDDGQPLGSKENDECKIDSITQSWAAISGAANPDHLSLALSSLNEHLVNEKDGLVLLFSPPFDKTQLNPGYIKGYLPGVRENGGQYTHAAIWAAMGFAANKDGDQAFKLMSMLNPINHTRSNQKALTYKVEPFVVSADIYVNPAHVGQGGWTWYTGSAGWYYRAFMESVLGIYREGNLLRIDPCLPKALGEYQVKYKYGSSLYEIQIKNTFVSLGEKPVISIDGQTIVKPNIPLTDDGRIHQVNIEFFTQKNST